MDLRPENILTRSGRPAAILDWGNALSGDLALDLARAANTARSHRRSWPAYGEPGHLHMTPASPRQTVYSLDTAVMLAHVFHDGVPDPDQARHYTDRTQALCQAKPAS